MSRLLLVSDYHQNHYKKQPFVLPTDDKFDILVVAGDICDGAIESAYTIKGLQKQTKNKCLYVLGNHDHWGYTFEAAYYAHHGIPGYMNRTITEINGQRFLGCTLWYKIPEDASRKHWSDFQYIIDWQGIDREYQRDQEFIEKHLQADDILITHMLPTWDCVDPQYRGDSNNRYYVSDIEDLIIKRKPKLVCSGHSHSPFFKKMHDTLFLRNPFGYPGYENKNHQWLVFDTTTNELKHIDADY